MRFYIIHPSFKSCNFLFNYINLPNCDIFYQFLVPLLKMLKCNFEKYGNLAPWKINIKKSLCLPHNVKLVEGKGLHNPYCALIQVYARFRRKLLSQSLGILKIC